MHTKTYLAASAIAVLNAAAISTSAAPFIVVGGSNLLPNQANQQIQLLVSGTEQVAGVTLFAVTCDDGLAGCADRVVTVRDGRLVPAEPSRAATLDRTRVIHELLRGMT